MFGGRVSQFDSQALPAGASPFNQDVIFSGGNAGGEVSVGGVGSRPGIFALYNPSGGNPTVNYLRTFVDSTGAPHQLELESSGTLRDDFPEGTFRTVSLTLVPGSFVQSDTYAGKEWLAFGDGRFGIDIPRQYDGTNLDRVSQVGPAVAPSAADENAPFTIAAAGVPGAQMMGALNVSSASQIGFLVTVQLTTFGFTNSQFVAKAGDQITVAGVGAGYNGTWPLAADVTAGPNANPALTFFVTTSGLAPVGAGGTVQFGYAIIFFTANETASQNIPLNAQATIAGVANTAYNGTFRVANSLFTGNAGNGFGQIIVNFNQFGQTSSGGGTAAVAGGISAGLHQVSVCYVLPSGYITCPAPPNHWTAAGNKRVVLSNIALGHSRVKARIVIFTPAITAPANTGPFFYFSGAVATATTTFPTMVIGDNVTTSGTFDFLDAVLQSATAASNLFNLLELGECSGVTTYSERTFWTGERNKVNSAGGGGGFNNLTFDGGFPYNGAQFQTPFGWTQDTTAGGRTGVTGGPPNCVWGDGLLITGDGVTAIPARIFQGAFQDYLGVPIIAAGTAYSARVRIATDISNNFGTFHIRFNSPSQGVPAPGLAIPLNTLTGNLILFSEAIQSLLPATAYPNTAAVPSDLRLEVYVDNSGGSGILGNTHSVAIDNIEIFPTALPINRTIVRVSYALQPEAFDGTTGFMIVGKDNGQAARCIFKLLDKKIYVVKERSFYSSQDDGANEPSLWSVDRISESVGTLSVNGAATAGEAWAVIASHDGAYIFWGAEPVKISQEEQPDWDTINWNVGQTIWAVVDQQNKRIHIGTPTGSSGVPNAEFVLDYSQLADAADIAANPQAHYAYFNPTNVVAPGRARKWSIWNLSSNSAAMTYRADGSYHLLRGNAIGNGKIYDQVATQTTDDGATINAIYQTYYFPDRMEEIQLQLGAHGKTFKFLTGYISGSGKVTWSTHGQQDNRVLPLTTLTLRSPDKWNFEMNVNFESERSSLIFATSGNATWFHLSYLAPTIQRSIARSVRGVA